MLRIHAFAIGIILAVVPAVCFAQERTDRVEYYDPTKPGRPPANRGGTITVENPIELVIVNNLDKKPFKIPATDVIDVVYDGEPAETPQARLAEKAKNLDKALAIYKDALKKVPANNKLAQTHLRFKVAQLSAKLSLSGTANARSEAIDELDKFRRDFPDSRQIIDCLMLLGELQLSEEKSVKDAADAFKTLRDKYKDNKEFAFRCEWYENGLALQEAQELFRKNAEEAKKRYGDIQTRLTTLLPLADKATAPELKILLAECKAGGGKLADALADLKTILDEAGDDRIRAAVYLCRGDCYRMNGKMREAMWDYLWVDVVYNQRNDQTAKALYHLAEVFKAFSDDERERKCRDRLKGEQFKDTRWAKAGM